MRFRRGFGTSGGFNNRTQRFKYGLPGWLYDAADEIYVTSGQIAAIKKRQTLILISCKRPHKKTHVDRW